MKKPAYIWFDKELKSDYNTLNIVALILVLMGLGVIVSNLYLRGGVFPTDVLIIFIFSVLSVMCLNFFSVLFKLYDRIKRLESKEAK